MKILLQSAQMQTLLPQPVSECMAALKTRVASQCLWLPKGKRSALIYSYAIAHQKSIKNFDVALLKTFDRRSRQHMHAIVEAVTHDDAPITVNGNATG